MRKQIITGVLLAALTMPVVVFADDASLIQSLKAQIAQLTLILQNLLSARGQGGQGATQSAPAQGGGGGQAVLSKTKGSPQVTLTQQDLLALADNKYADGEVPLGDKKYVTGTFKKGSVFFCNVPRNEDGGAGADGPWIHGTTWNYKQKLDISGDVTWPNAQFSATVNGDSRTLKGNGLPVTHHTGTFPIPSSDAVYAYDRNPNSIKTQTESDTVPVHPVYSDTPYCMSMESGMMLSGVPLFNAFDAGLRDAPAHEAQDKCDGHPQGNGQYHYHGISDCFNDESVQTVLGYALDGFPITGNKVADSKFLSTEDLDECHGITSEVLLDGKKTVSYHYVMTRDFPYSVSCFRGKPSRTGPNNGGGMMQGMSQGIGQMIGSFMGGGQNTSQTGAGQGTPPAGGPPQEALNACSGKSRGVSCSFTGGMGSVKGICDGPQNAQQLACRPQQ